MIWRALSTVSPCLTKKIVVSIGAKLRKSREKNKEIRSFLPFYSISSAKSLHVSTFYTIFVAEFCVNWLQDFVGKQSERAVIIEKRYASSCGMKPRKFHNRVQDDMMISHVYSVRLVSGSLHIGFPRTTYQRLEIFSLTLHVYN